MTAFDIFTSPRLEIRLRETTVLVLGGYFASTNKENAKKIVELDDFP